MTRKTRRELAREIEDLRDDEDAVEFQVSSTVVTVTEDMTDERGRLVDEVTAPADATVLPTESDIVTVWSEHMD